MPYGSKTYGESAYGEAGTFDGGAVDGFALITEAADASIILGSVPVVSVSAIADGNLLVIVLELELGYFGEPEPPVTPPITTGLVFVDTVFVSGVFV